MFTRNFLIQLIFKSISLQQDILKAFYINTAGGCWTAYLWRENKTKRENTKYGKQAGAELCQAQVKLD